jgi:hypothetical protein
MPDITDIPSALTELRAFQANMPASTPEPLAAELTTAVAEISPVDGIMRAVEAMYAHLGSLTIAGKELLVGLLGIATPFGWHGLSGTDGRGMGMAKAVRRELGEEPVTGSWPDPEDDPLPLDRFAQAEPLSPVPAQPEPE